jgi:hypothetical protein
MCACPKMPFAIPEAAARTPELPFRAMIAGMSLS